MTYRKIKGTGPVREHFLGRWIKGYGRYMKFKHDLAITRSNYIAETRLRAIGILEDHGWKAASEAGTAYLIEDTSWKNWCWTGKPYDGPAYGIYIVHPDGRKTIYWHIKP